MGAKIELKEKINVIWIDPNIDNEENIFYVNQLKTIGSLKINLFKKIEGAITFLKTILFQETKIIVSGKLYDELIKNFKDNILDMHVAPKILVFTSDINKFINDSSEYKNKNNYFYNKGGITTIFNGVKYFLENKVIKNENKIGKIISNRTFEIQLTSEIQLTFEYIDNKYKLMLPLFFKTLLTDISKADDITNYTKQLYNVYSKEKIEIQKLLGQIESMTDIPIEILSQYYARLYTANSSFYKNINKDLGTNKIEQYLIFIKILYEGVKLKSLPLSKDNILYRGARISNNEIEKIKEYISRRIDGLPCAIVFSRSFLSFSKVKNVADYFLSAENNDKTLSKVLFILEKDDNIGYNLSTHGDIEKISFIPNEKEVLFFPFSSFEIKDIKETDIGTEKGYQINLLYLGKYLKDIETDKNLVINENKIPDSEFKKQLSEFGLIKKESIENINSKKLYNSYIQYEKSIYGNNYINGEINISSKDINKEIQIINSFENSKRMDKYEDKEDDWKYKNEKEIKENIIIRIDGKFIEFSYIHKFKKAGKYKIEYLFKRKLKNISYMFHHCSNLTFLDLSNFKTQYAINMSDLFCRCDNLKEINLSNINTKNVTDMSWIFSGCGSLLYLDLSSFDTQNVTDMSYMFNFCFSLKNINLSSFNTRNVSNMSHMFSHCEALTNLDLSNFKCTNITNMSEMFHSCKSLTNIDLSNFNTQNVTDMNWIFYGCKSLTNLNLTNFSSQRVTNINSIFSGCKSLRKNNIITKDSKILKSFRV